MNILVTGSEGSLAQIVIPRLLECGHTVTGVDNLSRWGKERRSHNYELIRGDLSETELVRKLFLDKHYDAVFHFAAIIYGVVGFHKRPADIIADNNLATINLLKFGRESIGRFIYLSSSMVYESCRTWPHREEDTETTPVMRTSYGLSKYIGERVVQSFHEQYGTDYVIWRPFNIITPFESAEEEGFSHVFSDMISKIIDKKQNPVDVLGDGEQIRCYTNIYDVAGAIADHSLDDRARNETFNIGNPEPVTVKDLIARIVNTAKSLGMLPADYTVNLKHLPVYSDDVRKRIPDIAKIEKIFGWQPTTLLDASLDLCLRNKLKSV